MFYCVYVLCGFKQLLKLSSVLKLTLADFKWDFPLNLNFLWDNLFHRFSKSKNLFQQSQTKNEKIYRPIIFFIFQKYRFSFLHIFLPLGERFIVYGKLSDFLVNPITKVCSNSSKVVVTTHFIHQICLWFIKLTIKLHLKNILLYLIFKLATYFHQNNILWHVTFHFIRCHFSAIGICFVHLVYNLDYCSSTYFRQDLDINKWMRF